MFGKTVKDGKAMVDNIKNDLEFLIDSIKEKYGNDSKIYSEFKILSKELSEPYKDILIDGKKIDSINGVVDLLVIDEHGSAHIYDFKISKKNVGI